MKMELKNSITRLENSGNSYKYNEWGWRKILGLEEKVQVTLKIIKAIVIAFGCSPEVKGKPLLLQTWSISEKVEELVHTAVEKKPTWKTLVKTVGQNKKTNPSSYRHRWWKTNTGQKHRLDCQQDHKWKLPQTKERQSHKDIRST